MKKLFTILLIIPLIWACSNDSEDIVEPDTNKEYIISLGLTGEITDITESPLTRATPSDLYGIQVYSTPNGEKKESPYAYGIFDNIGNITVKLLEGYNYRFECTMVVDGVNKIINLDGKYYLPFSLKGDDYVKPTLNGFIYDKGVYFSLLGIGAAQLKEFKKPYEVPQTDRYYGEYSNFKPKKDGTLTINMKRTVFGLKVIAEDLSDGELVISMPYALDLFISHPNTTIENILTFKSVSKAYHTENYTELMPVIFSWKRSDGAIIPIASKEIAFKRNKLTTITIKVGDTSINNGLNIDKELGEYNGEEKITIDLANPNDTKVNPKSRVDKN